MSNRRVESEGASTLLSQEEGDEKKKKGLGLKSNKRVLNLNERQLKEETRKERDKRIRGRTCDFN